MQTCGLYFLPGAASAGHGGGWHEYPSGQESANAERFPHLPVSAWLVLYREPGKGPASSGGLSHSQSRFISSRLHHWNCEFFLNKSEFVAHVNVMLWSVHVPQISLEFRKLAQVYRDVISEICHRMGVGMAEFLEKKVGSMKEWDLVNNRLICLLFRGWKYLYTV